MCGAVRFNLSVDVRLRMFSPETITWSRARLSTSWTRFELTCASEGTSGNSRASTVIPDDMGLARAAYAFDERLDHLAYPRC